MPVSPIPGRVAAEAETPRATVSVPLVIETACSSQAGQPVTLGVPLPRGAVRAPETLHLLDADGGPVPVQSRALSRWPDRSIKWVLLDFVLGAMSQGRAYWKLDSTDGQSTDPFWQPVRVKELAQSVVVETGEATFHVGRDTMPFSRVLIAGQDVIDPRSIGVTLSGGRRRECTPRVERIFLEASGPARATIKLEGVFTGRLPCRFVIRVCFFAGTGLVRLRLTIHNPKRARHRGGLWDQGDPQSLLIRELALKLALPEGSRPDIVWSAEPAGPLSRSAGDFEIYQDSSGGENWRSRNHMNRFGQVPCSFRGYRVRSGGQETFGLRANPVVSLQGSSGGVTAALPEFWQQFPRALEVTGRLLRIGLFPRQSADLQELQGGEQKTHTVWLHFCASGNSTPATLEWVHRPARVHATPEWCKSSGALPYVASAPNRAGGRWETFLAELTDGENDLVARRENIDEYGWRNYGEVFADHENAYYAGPRPVISHYNNQYDLLYGALLQYLRTGNLRWFDLLDPLARHVMDIDIYHTDQDKAAYNGGLFWHTDHYHDAATCTHRAFSRWNCPSRGQPYGGGPSAEHNYTTGLLHYYFLTGEPRAREAAIGLADWVINCDDGRENILGLLDDGPTGLASGTGLPNYHGPGRGCGNSVNALLDAWTITEERRYLTKAESLIRRSIHPASDIAAQDLLNVEARWSYTVFLSMLCRYLSLKVEAGEIDSMYDYAQASLLAYARWMLANEVPYFDHLEKLAFPTETWAAQELRKANVLRLAAQHADEPLRSQLFRRGDEFAERAWNDLFRFPTRFVARAVAILLIEGPCDAYFRSGRLTSAPRSNDRYESGPPEAFVPQKARIRAEFKSFLGLARALMKLSDVRRWWRYYSRISG